MNEERGGKEASGRASGRARELGEDIEVAVGEFLERHPDARPTEIRRGLRIAAMQTGPGVSRRRWKFLLLVLVAVLLTWLLMA